MQYKHVHMLLITRVIENIYMYMSQHCVSALVDQFVCVPEALHAAQITTWEVAHVA